MATPNPFRGATDLRFVVGGATSVDLAVLDLQGRLVRSPVAHARWDGRDESANALPAGAYWLVLRADGHTLARRVVRLD